MKDRCLFCKKIVDKKDMVEIFDQNGETTMVCLHHHGVEKLHEIWLKDLGESNK